MSRDITKLPKWAQARIRQLEREVEEATKELEFSESQKQTRTGQGFDTRPKSVGQPRRWLPDEHVTFYLPDRNRQLDTYIQVRFERWREQTVLRVMGSDGPLVITPVASNVVHITVGKR